MTAIDFQNPSLHIVAPGQLALSDAPLPTLATGEVGVRVHYVALCGSDVKLYQGAYKAPHTYPVLVGHEWVGRVESLSPEAAQDWKVGEVVTGDCSVFCGQCPRCAVDVNQCLTIEKRGITRDGGCARHIAIPGMHLHRCPEVADLKPYTLTEPMSVAIQGIHNRIPRTRLERVQKALIVGGGGIGLSALISLLDLNLPSITVVDPVAEKRTLIDSFGLKNIRTLGEFPAEDDSFDLIVEAAGVGTAVPRAFELAAPNGFVVCLGHQGKLEIDGALLIKKSLNLLGSIGSSGGFDQAIEVIGNHTAQVERLITRIVPLAEAEEFFAEQLAREANIKVLIEIG